MGTEVRVVEAATHFCPSRTLWVLGDDGWWHCHCCTTVKAWDGLVDPTPVDAAEVE